jgi:MraZ protein
MTEHSSISAAAGIKFRGRFTRNLDAKGRLMLPPEFREILLARSEEGHMVLTTYDNCVVGYPLPDWTEFEDKLNGIKNPTLQIRHFKRLVIGGAEEMTADAQGRIRLSRDHLDSAGITGEVMVMGQGTHFELWQPTRLKDILHRNFDDVAADLPDGLDLIF